MVIAEQVFKGFLKGAVKIDLNNDGKDDVMWNVAIPDIKIPEEFNDSSFSLLIFDDLERCRIDIENILGYINSFVESKDLKVVIIANEEEINQKEKYKIIKEKLIGQDLEIYSDFKGALNYFINQIKNQRSKRILLDHLNLIQELFQEKAKSQNLRTLKKITLNFERVFDALPEKAQNKPELIKEILELLVILSIETASGKLNPKDISKIKDKLEVEGVDSVRLAKTRNENRTEETAPFTQLFQKYKISHSKLNGLFPSLLWWESFFDKGIVNKDILEKEILNNKYFLDETTPNWLKLWHYTRHSDEEFSEILHQVDSEYKDRKFEDIGIIKHITGLFLMFSDVNLYRKSKPDIVKEAKKYIDDLKSYGKLDLKDGNHISNGCSYMELDFQAQDYQEFKDFNNYIKQCQGEEIEKNMPNEAKKLLDIMQKDVFIFHYCITDSINLDISEKRYFDYPIFKHLLAQDFIRKILTNKEIFYVFDALQERYNVNGFVEKLVDELDFLKEVQQLLLKEVDARKGKLSGFLLKLPNEILEKVISDLEQVKNSLPTTN